MKTDQPTAESYPWGIASPRRGTKYHAIAVEFIKTYPKETILENSELVEIGKSLFGFTDMGYYPPSYFARKLTISGTHPRMGKNAFAVVLTPEGLYRVLDPLIGWQIIDLGETIERKIRSLLSYNNYKLQAKNFVDLPTDIQKAIRRVYREYERLQELNAVLHGPIMERLSDLAETLENYYE